MSRFMDRIFYENEMTRTVTSVRMDAFQPMVVFGADSSQLCQDKILEEFRKEQTRLGKYKPLRTQIANWLRQRFNFGTNTGAKYLPVTVR